MKRFRKLSIVLTLVLLFTSLFGTAVFAAERMGGNTRIETAVAISQAWEESNAVVLATGSNYPDALVAGPLAAALDAPILLAYTNILPEATKDRIVELGASTVYIVGGPGVISAEVEAELRDVVATVDRVWGDNRYETAIEVAKKVKLLKGSIDKAYVVNGYSFEGALAVGPLAASEGAVLLYADGNQWDEVSADALDVLGNPDVTVVGSTDMISDESAALFGTVDRIDGDDVYELGLAVAALFDDPAAVAIAVGSDYPDALAGSALKVPMLFVQNGAASLGAANLAYLQDNSDTLGAAYILGGSAVVTDAVFAEVDALVEAPVAIVSAAPVGIKTVEVRLNKSVDTSKVTVQIKKGAAIYSTKVEWNDSKNVATVTTVINLPAGDYTAVAIEDGVTSTKTFTVNDAVASGVEITSTTIDDGDSAAQVAFVVKNQYGEDMGVNANDPSIAVYAYNETQKASVTVVKPAQKYFTVDTAASPDAFKVGDVIRFTVIYKGMSVQKYITVVEQSSAASISLGAIRLADDDANKMLNVSDGTVKLDYTMIDQYGNVTYLSPTGESALAGGVTINGVTFHTSNASVISHLSVVNNADGHGEIILKIAGAGTAVITAVLNETGIVSNAVVVVNNDSAAKAVAISAPTMLVASQDPAFDLDLIITDQYGAIIKSISSDLSAEIEGLGEAGSKVNFDLTDVDGATKLNVDLSGLDNEDVNDTKRVTINIKNAGGDVLGSVAFDVEPEAVAQEVKAANFAKVFENGATHTVVADDLTVVDQYGRAFKNGTIVVTSSDVTVISVSDSKKLDAKKVGSAKLTVKVDTVTLEVDVAVIASDDIKGYSMNDLGTIYAGKEVSKYHKAVTINGVDANGNAVKLVSNSPDFISTSNAAVADVSGTTVKGMAAGTATISAWKNGVKVASANVTVSDAAPVATSIEWTATQIAKGANVDSIVLVKDQYGVDITSTTTLFFAGGGDVVETDGDVIGDAGTATITVITSNGLSATADITVVTPQ